MLHLQSSFIYSVQGNFPLCSLVKHFQFRFLSWQRQCRVSHWLTPIVARPHQNCLANTPNLPRNRRASARSMTLEPRRFRHRSSSPVISQERPQATGTPKPNRLCKNFKKTTAGRLNWSPTPAQLSSLALGRHTTPAWVRLLQLRPPAKHPRLLTLYRGRSALHSRPKEGQSALFFVSRLTCRPRYKLLDPMEKTWSITSSLVAGKLPVLPRAPLSSHIRSQ